MAEAQSNKRLLAMAYIIPAGSSREYFPGDALPPDHPDVGAWIEAGTAVWVDADKPASTHTMARMATAPAGLPGAAVGGEITGDDLHGRVPATPQRGRSRRKK